MEFKNDQAIYLQIANQFFENILQGKWQRGEKIPSIREMAVQFEVNPNTALRTFNYLQEKGIIFNKRGLGYFLADDGLERTMALKKEQFINIDIPELFRNLQLLGMDIDDLKKYFQK